MFLADLVLLQVVEQHQHDPHDFLPTAVVEDLGNLFQEAEGVISEVS